MATTAIEWAEHVWNPVVGCAWASPGCDHCYAATMTRRLEAMGKPDYAGLTSHKHFNGTVRPLDHKLDVPLRRRKPTTWFVNSMSDLFHKDVPFEFIERVHDVMRECRQHTFQILTKRPERMVEYWEWRQREYLSPNRISRPPQNAWYGTSVENQEQADIRIPHLLRCPAAVRFLSCEPLLGAIRLDQCAGYTLGGDESNPGYLNAFNAMCHHPATVGFAPSKSGTADGIHWVIVGGESGPGARPMHPQWPRDIRDQCAAAGVPYFFKQWGAWCGGMDFCSGSDEGGPAGLYAELHNGEAVREATVATGAWHNWNEESGDSSVNDWVSVRVGKKRAGRLLDGVEHNELPTKERSNVSE